MSLSKEDILKFKEIYFEKYQEEIPIEDAEDLAKRLLYLFKITYRPIPKIKK